MNSELKIKRKTKQEINLNCGCFLVFFRKNNTKINTFCLSCTEHDLPELFENKWRKIEQRESTYLSSR